MMLSGRQRLRTRLRDGAALSAFLGVALSGLVPPWALGAFGLSFVLSLFGVHPLAGRRVWSAVALLLTAGVLFGLVFVGVLDLIVAAVAFAVLVTAHRISSESTRAVDQQVLLASLLLMAGGAALSGELWYSVCLTGFGICSCLHLGLAALEGPEEKDELLPISPVVRQLSIGVAFSLLAGVIFFVTFPRLSWNLAARRTPPGILGAAPGMSDRVSMAGSGSLKTSARIVARISLSPDPKEDQLDQYWPGRVFDQFDGREWTGSGVELRPALNVRLAKGPRSPVWQKIELLPAYQARTLIALRAPLLFGNASLQTSNGPTTTMLIEARGEEVRFASTANGYTYSASSAPPIDHPEEALEDRQKFLALPPLDPRVAPLITKMANGETEPLKIAGTLQRWLKRDFEYTLDVPGEQADPLADFLFVRKAGRCEHFAFALAVALRTQGVPSRVVAGFFGGERLNDVYVLRAGDAHAWTQAFIEGKGWVDYDATPDAGRRAHPNPLLAALNSLYEQLESAWRSRVVDYSLQDQVNFVRELARPPPNVASGTSSFSVPWKRLLGALFAGFVAFAVLRLVQRRVPPRRHDATNFLNKVEGLLAERKIVRIDGEGLEEQSRRLLLANHPLGPALQEVTRGYLRARFGGQPLSRAESDRLLGLLGSKA